MLQQNSVLKVKPGASLPLSDILSPSSFNILNTSVKLPEFTVITMDMLKANGGTHYSNLAVDHCQSG